MCLFENDLVSIEFIFFAKIQQMLETLVKENSIKLFSIDDMKNKLLLDK